MRLAMILVIGLCGFSSVCHAQQGRGTNGAIMCWKDQLIDCDVYMCDQGLFNLGYCQGCTEPFFTSEGPVSICDKSEDDEQYEAWEFAKVSMAVESDSGSSGKVNGITVQCGVKHMCETLCESSNPFQPELGTFSCVSSYLNSGAYNFTSTKASGDPCPPAPGN